MPKRASQALHPGTLNRYQARKADLPLLLPKKEIKCLDSVMRVRHDMKSINLSIR